MWHRGTQSRSHWLAWWTLETELEQRDNDHVSQSQWFLGHCEKSWLTTFGVMLRTACVWDREGSLDIFLNQKFLNYKELGITHTPLRIYGAFIRREQWPPMMPRVKSMSQGHMKSGSGNCTGSWGVLFTTYETLWLLFFSLFCLCLTVLSLCVLFLPAFWLSWVNKSYNSEFEH